MGYLVDYGDYLLKNRLPKIIEENDVFKVLQYKIVMREEVDIERGEHPSNKYNPHCHENIHNKIREWVDGSNPSPNPKQYDFKFFPLYFMHYYHVLNERSVFYAGMTNSNTDRFNNHVKLEEFIKNVPIRKDRKLHMCQLLVTYLHDDTVYENIPLEWIFFEEDLEKEPRYTLINKIITFVETAALISSNTDRNDAYCIPKVAKDIYTANLRIIDARSGTTFFANNSLHPNTLEEEVGKGRDAMSYVVSMDVETIGRSVDGNLVFGDKEENEDKIDNTHRGCAGEPEELNPYDDENILPENSQYLKDMRTDVGNNREFWTKKIYVNNKKELNYDDYIDFLERE